MKDMGYATPVQGLLDSKGIMIHRLRTAALADVLLPFQMKIKGRQTSSCALFGQLS